MASENNENFIDDSFGIPNPEPAQEIEFDPKRAVVEEAQPNEAQSEPEQAASSEPGRLSEPESEPESKSKPESGLEPASASEAESESDSGVTVASTADVKTNEVEPSAGREGELEPGTAEAVRPAGSQAAQRLPVEGCSGMQQPPMTPQNRTSCAAQPIRPHACHPMQPPTQPPVQQTTVSPVRTEPQEEEDDKPKRIRGHQVASIMLAAISALCILAAVLMFAGIGPFGPSSAKPQPTVQSAHFFQDGVPAGDIEDTGEKSAAYENRDTNVASTQTYTYLIKGASGDVHEVVENATFENGSLKSTDLHISANSHEEAGAILRQLKQEFDENMSDGMTSSSEAICTIALPGNDYTPESYTNLLSEKASQFKVLSR